MTPFRAGLILAVVALSHSLYLGLKVLGHSQSGGEVITKSDRLVSIALNVLAGVVLYVAFEMRARERRKNRKP